MLRLLQFQSIYSLLAMSLCVAAVGQQIPGRVQEVSGTTLPHATVRIEGAGSTETSDSGEFTFSLSDHLKVGYPAVFHVANWVILKPCELRNGRTYLRDPAAEPIELFVLHPGDPRLKSATTNESIVDCLIEEEVSQLVPKHRPSSGVSSSKKQYSLSMTQHTSENPGTDAQGAPNYSNFRLVASAYYPSVHHVSLQSPSEESDGAMDAERSKFLARKSKELGLSAQELEAMIETWASAVEDLYQKGLAALYAGRYMEASEYISKSLTTPTGNVLAHNVQLACAEYWQGHYSAAESALRRVLVVYHNDPIVLNNLALILGEQAKFGEAEPLSKDALAYDETALGADSPEIATDLNTLAWLYVHQGKYHQAEPLYARATAIDEILGPNDTNFARDLNNLAVLYVHEGKYDQAEPLYKRALEITEKSLGRNHPYVAVTLCSLAMLYDRQGKYSQAERLCTRALAIDEKTLGPDHPDVAQILNNLALLYDDQRKYSEAEPLYERALGIDRKALGPDHPDYATDLNNLAGLYVAEGKFREARTLYEQALAIREKALGLEHPDIATSLNGLATLCLRDGEFGDAERLYIRALAVREKALGPNHPDVALSLSNLAGLYYYIGEYSEAEKLLRRALAISKTAWGLDTQVAEIAGHLSLALRKLGRIAEAEEYEEQVANIREKAVKEHQQSNVKRGAT